MKRPWFPFYAADFLVDENVMAMTLEERGAYITLLALQWREGSIPANEQRLAKLLGVTADDYSESFKPMVEALFVPSAAGRLSNPRLERERQEAEALSHAGHIGGKARALQSVRDGKGRYSEPSGSPAVVPAVDHATDQRTSSLSQSQSQSQEEDTHPARARMEPMARIWSERTGILLPGAGDIDLVRQRVADYADAANRTVAEVLIEAIDAFKRLVASWSVPQPLTPALFLRRWDEVQAVMSGHDPGARASPGKARKFTDAIELTETETKVLKNV